MNAPRVELVWAGILVLLLVGLAGYYGWRQIQTLLRLRQPGEIDASERGYYLAQARRRLISCVLMIVLAGLLVSSYVLGQERQAAELARTGHTRLGQPNDLQTAEAQRQFLNRYGAFWMIFALVLLALLSLAFVDLWAIRRFAVRQYRQIQADRREMIEREVSRLRGHERNGH